PRADELKVEAYFSQEPSRHGPVSLRRCPPPAEPAARRIQAMVARRAAQELLSLLALDPSLREVDPARLVYFDTETSGLGGAGSVAFLVGLAFFDATGELVLEQYLMSSPEQELALLERVRERFE